MKVLTFPFYSPPLPHPQSTTVLFHLNAALLLLGLVRMTKLERVEVDMLQGSEEESIFTPAPLVKQAQSTFGLLLRGCESIDLYRLFTNFNIQVRHTRLAVGITELLNSLF